MDTHANDLSRIKFMIAGLLLAIVFVVAMVLAADGAAGSETVESAFLRSTFRWNTGLSWQ